jgi:tetratricopeptide (TPR) repeat protein
MKGRLASLSVALLLVISGCSTVTPKNNVHQLQDSGEKYLAAGDTAGSLKYLTDAEQKSPNDPVIQYDLALAYDKRGLEDKALAHLKNALKIKPAYPEALNAIGAVYARRGQFQLAQESFQKVLDDPFYKTPQLAAYNLGSLYEKRGDVERALTEYQQAVKFDPHYGAAWFRIGQIFEQLNQGDDARHAYGKAVAFSPDLAEAQLRYGILSYQAGDMEAALGSLSKVGKLAPDSSMADEARRYLEKLSTPARTTGHGSRASSYSPPGDIEVIPNEDVQSYHSPQSVPPPINEDSMKSQPPQLEREIPGETQAPATANVPASTGEAAPAQQETSQGLESSSCKYVVQLGSFVDGNKAEEIKESLVSKGFSAIVKPMKHRTLGKVFIIQLQPVNSISRATTLSAQLHSEIEGEPVILKIPSK